MKLPEFGVNRPVATAMLFIGVLTLGIVCLTKLGVDLTPEIEPTRVTVSTIWQGASCEDVEQKVTRVLEKRLGSVANLEEIRSTTSEGRSSITCEFAWGTNIDEASNDVRSKIDAVKRNLPEDVDDPAIYKFDSSAMPVMVIGVTARESIEKLYEIIDDEVFQPLQRLEGIGAVDAFGGLQRQINVTLSRERLAGYGLTLRDIENAIANENRTLPAGNLKIGIIEYTIRILGDYVSPEQIKEIPLLQKDGAIVRLKDIAQISDSFREITQYVETMGRDGMMMIVQKRSGANTVSVCEAVRKELARLEAIVPRDIEFYIVNDTSTFITQAINNVKGTVYWGGLFVVLLPAQFPHIDDHCADHSLLADYCFLFHVFHGLDHQYDQPVRSGDCHRHGCRQCNRSAGKYHQPCEQRRQGARSIHVCRLRSRTLPRCLDRNYHLRFPAAGLCGRCYGDHVPAARWLSDRNAAGQPGLCNDSHSHAQQQTAENHSENQG